MQLFASMERDVAHIREDLGDVKGELLNFRDRFDRVTEASNEQFAEIRRELSDLRAGQEQLRTGLHRSLLGLTRWAITGYLTLAAGLLSVMAKAFGWI